MQTFLTDKNFAVSASYLDSKRLNKQILEARQLLNIMARKNAGETKVAWENHPACRSWIGYESGFLQYILAHIHEAVRRGIKTDLNWQAVNNIYSANFATMSLVYPPWYEDLIEVDKVISTHQGNLYRKDPEYYAEWKWISDWLYENAYWSVCHPKEYRRNGIKTQACSYYFPSHMEAL